MLFHCRSIIQHFAKTCTHVHQSCNLKNLVETNLCDRLQFKNEREGFEEIREHDRFIFSNEKLSNFPCNCTTYTVYSLFRYLHNLQGMQINLRPTQSNQILMANIGKRLIGNQCNNAYIFCFSYNLILQFQSVYTHLVQWFYLHLLFTCSSTLILLLVVKVLSFFV